MTISCDEWGVERRFYLPNEDARCVAAALQLLPSPAQAPVFVGGSGMVLLAAASVLPEARRPVFADISRFQVEFFARLVRALDQAHSPRDMREWFAETVYPGLLAHYAQRGQVYSLDQVMAALDALFGIDFFRDETALAQAKAVARVTDAHCGDIGRYLEQTPQAHDFVYLSNVPDYLPETALTDLFASCAKLRASVYVLVTGACPITGAVSQAWAKAGFTAHPGSAHLNEMNQGLGSARLKRSWNRPGIIALLLPRNGPHKA